MSMDYKTKVYSYRRDPTGRRNECRTSYGRMHTWQLDEEIYRESFLQNRSPLCHETYLETRDSADAWQGVKPKKVIEVLQARGKRHLFIYDDLSPIAGRPKVANHVDCSCAARLPEDRYDHLLGASCYSSYCQQPQQQQQHESMADVLCSPNMRLNRRTYARNNNLSKSAAYGGDQDNAPLNSLDRAILNDIVGPALPEKHVSRSEVTAIERENWKLIR